MVQHARGIALRPLPLCGVLMLLGLAWPAQARLNLPQVPHTAQFSDKDRRTLEAAWVYASPGHPPAMTVPLQELLVDELPKETRNACGEMIEHWGTVAEGTARWMPRWLDSVRAPGRVTILVAYRCGSSYPDYADYYDERLGVVTLEPAAASLRLVPLGDDCDNCSDLYRLRLEQIFPTSQGSLAVIAATNTSDNPCCDGPSQWNEERLHFVFLPEGGVTLTVTRVSEHYFHDDESGDTAEICRADVSYVRDAAGRLSEIAALTRCQTDDKPQPVKSQRYRWSGSTQRFDEVPPTKP